MKKLLVLFALVASLMFVPVASAQNGHKNGHKNGHAQQPYQQAHRGGHEGRVSGRNFGNGHRGRFVRGNVVVFGGRECYRFNGTYFYAGFWPDWFFEEEVYFVLAPDGFWYAHSYRQPGLFFQVYIAD